MVAIDEGDPFLLSEGDRVAQSTDLGEPSWATWSSARVKRLQRSVEDGRVVRKEHFPDTEWVSRWGKEDDEYEEFGEYPWFQVAGSIAKQDSEERIEEHQEEYGSFEGEGSWEGEEGGTYEC